MVDTDSPAKSNIQTLQNDINSDSNCSSKMSVQMILNKLKPYFNKTVNVKR